MPSKLLFALAFPALSAAHFRTTSLIIADSVRLLRLGLLQVVLGDPLFLVTTSTGSSDIANWCADGRGLAFLGLGNERDIGVVASSTEGSQDDEIGDPPGS